MMDNALPAILAVIAGLGLATMIASVVIIVIAWRGMARSYRLQHMMLGPRLQAMSASRRRLPHKGTAGFK